MSDVIILGAGPAGCAIALGLRRLGVDVRILSRPRDDTVEGISPRTVDLLQTLGLVETARECTAVTPRVAYWAGKRITNSRESLVCRASFDAALARDLAAAGLEILPATVRETRSGLSGFRVTTDAGEFQAHCVIDARGRCARRADELGPRLVAWSEIHQPVEALPRGSALVALERGWCWIASTGECPGGRLLLLYVGSAHCAEPASSVCQLAAAAQYAPELARSLALTKSERLATTSARAAVARFSLPARVPGMLRVGDAAVAMDPLSGHGVFEALRGAQAAIAAVHSYLDGMEWAPIARFLNERASEVWRRALAAAARFYRLEADHASTAFWTATADAYAACAELAGPKHTGPARIETRPVLNGSRIELRDLWVSADWPRGVWQVNGRDWRPTSGEGMEGID